MPFVTCRGMSALLNVSRYERDILLNLAQVQNLGAGIFCVDFNVFSNPFESSMRLNFHSVYATFGLKCSRHGTLGRSETHIKFSAFSLKFQSKIVTYNQDQFKRVVLWFA